MNIAVTGNPGVGKTLFSDLLLKRIIEDKKGKIIPFDELDDCRYIANSYCHVLQWQYLSFTHPYEAAIAMLLGVKLSEVQSPEFKDQNHIFITQTIYQMNQIWGTTSITDKVIQKGKCPNVIYDGVPFGVKLRNSLIVDIVSRAQEPQEGIIEIVNTGNIDDFYRNVLEFYEEYIK